MKSNFEAPVLFLITSLFLSCNLNKVENNELKNTIEDKNLSSALIKGYFIQEKGISICIYQNTIYLLTDAKAGFDKNMFLLHYIDQERNFLNRDFHMETFLVKDTLLVKYKNLKVIKMPLMEGSYESIRIGQFERNKNNQTKNTWVKEISVQDINHRRSYYKNEFKEMLSHNIIKQSFEQSLLHNTFFKTSQNLYVLYDNDFIYFLAPEKLPTNNKFMLHFINEENTFLNFSFNFEEYEIQEQLEKEIKIARVPIPFQEPFYKVRIGQFNSNGNIWVQEFLPEKLKANSLLRYDGEFPLLSQ